MSCFLSSFLPPDPPIFLISLATKSFSTSSKMPLRLSSLYFSSRSSAEGVWAAQWLVSGVSTFSQCRALSFFLGRITGRPTEGEAVKAGFWGK